MVIDRRTFVAVLLPAMVLAPLGLRLSKGRSLSGCCLPAPEGTQWATARFPRWSARVQPNSGPITEATLEKAYQACLRQPSYPDEVIISARTARMLNRRGYWR